MAKSVQIRLKRTPHKYEIQIGHGLLAESGKWTKSCLPPGCKKIAIISNKKVFSLYGETVCSSLRKEGYEVFAWLMPDGEQFKNLKYFAKALEFLSKSGIKRSDAVVALGGGVVGDMAGFTAASYLRGIAYLQIPTTLLSQIDSSVGGKTAVNADFGKNMIGAFYQPNGVLIDVSTLKTLPRRELTAGFCEAVKQGAIGSNKLFNQTRNFLQKYEVTRFSTYFSQGSFLDNLESLIAAHVGFKAKIVKGDESETLSRLDASSRKILNFGHTVAHALEKATDYKYFKHGEAVGYGMLVAAQISKNVGILDKNIVTLLNDVIYSAGSLPDIKNITAKEIFDLFIFDKKNVNQSLQWILLEAIGKPIIKPGHEIKDPAILKSISSVLEKK